MDDFMEATAEAKQGLQEGGIPIGSVLVRMDRFLAEDITSVCKTVILSPTLKSIAYATPVESKGYNSLFHLNALLSLRWGSCPVWD